MDPLRSRLIRLAHAQPQLRADILPLITKSASEPRTIQGAIQAISHILKNRDFMILDPIMEDLEKTLAALSEDAKEKAKANERFVTEVSGFRSHLTKGARNIPNNVLQDLLQTLRDL